MLYYYHEDAIHVSKLNLLVNDLSKSKSFYTNSLGFSILEETNEYISLTVDHKNEMIRLQRDNHPSKDKDPQIMYHFSILLPTRKDLSKFLHHLIVNQIPIDGAADHVVSEAIYLQDPDGIGIEIGCDRDDSQWLKLNDKIKMDSLPFDYEGVFYAAGEGDIFTALPTETTIGHVHLQSNNIEKQKLFYQNIIGFDVMKASKNDSVYMADKNYHHHISINSIQDHLKKHYRMKSITISYPNCEKFKKAYESIVDSNIHFEETLDGLEITDPENIKVYIKMK